ncbi:hypothetical protein [Celerinatantimonas diazotrophica]|uniref:Uncharacterized protein n=1 Tax=Celerinatantimonas diazotrophica TaxID=412034 RepID=A0A4R1JLM3_9GAMM|nr:hypothetical protein [Celerinatantimonas diazotrophica]TCK51952.1 hypothetical protein EV690_2045 [Celerinatantimonas diazotrophica]CAG9296349.1 hypothetical protein CEDIAZO_01498 [Celerinatantimonas diazotrophica]
MKIVVIAIIAFIIARIILKKTDKNPPSNAARSKRHDDAKSEQLFKNSGDVRSHHATGQNSFSHDRWQNNLGPFPAQLRINGVVYRDAEVIQAILTYIQYGRVLDKLPDEIMFVPDAQLDEVLQNCSSRTQSAGWRSDYVKPAQPSPYRRTKQIVTHASKSTKSDLNRATVAKPPSSQSSSYSETIYQTQYRSQYKSQFSDHDANDDKNSN